MIRRSSLNMLPFLKKQQVAGLIISKHRQPSGSIEESSPKGHDEGLEACARDMITALDSKDSRQLAQALRNAFEIMESEPHEEGPHTNDNEEEHEE